MKMIKEYLGDGVYITKDDVGLYLTTENGITISNTIYLEPETVFNLFNFAVRKRIVVGKIDDIKLN